MDPFPIPQAAEPWALVIFWRFWCSDEKKAPPFQRFS